MLIEVDLRLLFERSDAAWWTDLNVLNIESDGFSFTANNVCFKKPAKLELAVCHNL